MKTGRIEKEANIMRAPKGSGYDFDFPDGSKIEVKGSRKDKFNVGLRLNSEDEVHFFEGGGEIFRVLDVFGKPKLHIFKGDASFLSHKVWATCNVPKHLQGEAIEL